MGRVIENPECCCGEDANCGCQNCRTVPNSQKHCCFKVTFTGITQGAEPDPFGFGCADGACGCYSLPTRVTFRGFGGGCHYDSASFTPLNQCMGPPAVDHNRRRYNNVPNQFDPDPIQDENCRADGSTDPDPHDHWTTEVTFGGGRWIHKHGHVEDEPDPPDCTSYGGLVCELDTPPADDDCAISEDSTALVTFQEIVQANFEDNIPERDSILDCLDLQCIEAMCGRVTEQVGVVISGAENPASGVCSDCEELNDTMYILTPRGIPWGPTSGQSAHTRGWIINQCQYECELPGICSGRVSDFQHSLGYRRLKFTHDPFETGQWRIDLTYLTYGPHVDPPRICQAPTTIALENSFHRTQDHPDFCSGVPGAIGFGLFNRTAPNRSRQICDGHIQAEVFMLGECLQTVEGHTVSPYVDLDAVCDELAQGE